MTPVSLDDLASSVVRVGDGRGFVVAARRGNYVITAAHVLPSFPPAHLLPYPEESTYKRFIGRLNAEPTVAAACVFVDPVADLAVLGPPDNQTFSDEADLYEEFTAALPPFAITSPAPSGLWRGQDSDGSVRYFRSNPAPADAYVLSLAGKWKACKTSHFGGPLLIEPGNLIKGGMSGSPLVSATGAALGVVSTGDATADRDSEADVANALAACVTNSLPARLLRALEAKED
jgi:hypothetical protein